MSRVPCKGVLLIPAVDGMVEVVLAVEINFTPLISSVPGKLKVAGDEATVGTELVGDFRSSLL